MSARCVMPRGESDSEYCLTRISRQPSRFYNTLKGPPFIVCSEVEIMKLEGRNGKKRLHQGTAVVAAMLLGGVLSSGAQAQTQPQISNATQKEASVAHHVSGPFDVKMNPQTSSEESIGRMSIDKQYHGDLEAGGKGEFLGVYGSVKGSAGYVAMEKVSGKLNGRSGSFVLQHSGTMTQGESGLTITVVPDSGTGELTGITGTMTIRIEAGGKHFYEFEYTLP